MSYRGCIERAIEAGAVKQDRGREMLDNLDKRVEGYVRAGDTPLQAETRAVDEMKIDAKRSLTARKIAIVRNMDKAEFRVSEIERLRAIGDTSAVKDYMIRSVEDVDVLAQQTQADAFAVMHHFLEQNQRGLLGLKAPSQPNSIVFALYGNAPDAMSTGWAKSVREASDLQTRQLQAEGVNAHIDENYHLPQTVDAALMLRAGPEKWVDDHMVDGMLDWDLMMKNSAEPIPAELAARREWLSNVYDVLTMDGAPKRGRLDPKRAGGMSARHSNKRTLRYKTADSWIANNEKYGSGDAVEQITRNTIGTAHDIALVQTLGTSPQTTLQILAGHIEESVVKATNKPFSADLNRPTRMLDLYMGAYTSEAQTLTGMVIANTKQILTAGLLGKATIAAVPGDFATAANTVLATGLGKGFAGDYAKLLTSGVSRGEARGMGLALDTFINANVGQARFIGDIYIPMVAGRISNASLRAVGLTGHTVIGQAAAAMSIRRTLAGDLQKSFDELPYADVLADSGVTAADWAQVQKIKRVKTRDFGDVINTRDLMDVMPANDAIDLKRKLDTAIMEVRDRMIPRATLRARTTLGTQPGAQNVLGQLIETLNQFKSFPLVIAQTHLMGRLYGRSQGQKVAYRTGVVLGLTAAGAVANDVHEIIKGNTPGDAEHHGTPEYWGRAAIRGGAFSLLGDVAGYLTGVNRFGDAEDAIVSSPLIGFLADVGDMTVGNAAKALAGKKTDFAADMGRMLRIIPGANTPATSALFTKYVTMEWMKELDPGAYSRIMSNQARDMRERGSQPLTEALR